MSGIDKSIPGARALRSVYFEIRAGEVRVLLGGNGARKSTPMKILSAIYARDGGENRMDGAAVTFGGPGAAQDVGVCIIHQ